MHESALLAALGAAVLFAASSSLQHHEASSAPAGLDGAVGLLRVVLGVAWSSAHAELARSEDVGLSSTGCDLDPGPREQRLATPSQPVGG